MKNQNLKSALGKMNSMMDENFSDMEILNPEQAMSLVGGEAPECTTKCFINICKGNCNTDCHTNTCCPQPQK